MAKTKTVKKKRLVLLDSHAILHRAYHALPDFSSPKGEPTGALYGLVAMLLKIIEELQPDYLIACYDLAGPTYRHEAFEGYKAGRVKTEDDLVAQIERSRDVYEAFGVRIFDAPGFEADDILGTLVEQTKNEKDLEVVIASGDMDTLQLIDGGRVRVYTLRKGIKDTVIYDEKAVRERFGFGPEHIADYKGLRGDPSDNIPGIRGIGEKTAIDLITRFGSIEDIYKKLQKSDAPFRKAGVKERMITLLREGEEEATFSKALATIRRDAPVVFSLPEKTWREKLDVEKILTLFGEFGFRTLSARVRSVFGGSEAGTEEVEASPSEAVSPEEVEKTALALWLLESDITNPALDDILDYGRTNAKTTTFAEAREYIFSQLSAQGLAGMYADVELPLRVVVRDMQERGILLDREYLAVLSKEFHTVLTRLESTIYELAGEVFNINSPKQLGVILFDTLGLGSGGKQKRTATGQRSTRESELVMLKGTHPIIDAILEYRELAKLTSTYVDALPKLADSEGRVHTTFQQAGTVTGRMSSQNPNLQNIPTRVDEGRNIRKAFVASPGMLLVSVDYSQIELRIAAILSGDEKLMEIFQRGEDVHSAVASQVFAVPATEVTSDMRRRAKVINFGILYGMGVNALRANLGGDTSRAEAQEFLNAYFNTFTRLAEYLEETKAHARKQGYTETLFGRRRHFAGIRSSVPYIRAAAERMALNAPMQGTQADIIRIAMVKIGAYLKEKFPKDSFMLLQVHDELVFEMNESFVKESVPEIRHLMESVLTEEQSRGVPVRTEAKVGKNWGEMQKLT